MRDVLRSAVLFILGATTGNTQTPTVSPSLITFQLTAYTLIPPEQPSGQFLAFGVGSSRVLFRLREIRPTNLPSGAATNFVIVSPSSGVASGDSRVRPIIALNPKVVPYMRPGNYELGVFFENPERPELGTSGVRVQLSLIYPGAPEIRSVTNAASLRPGISPGQLVTIRGARLSSPPVTGEVDSAGLYPTVISHTRVTFNGIPAPLLYVSNDQINCVVPYAIAGSNTAQVAIELVSPGVVPPLVSPAVTVPVADASPGIFTADQSGSGPGAILNTGAGTANTEANPAPAGAAITLYATGAGAWNVAYPDGALVFTATLGLAPPSPEFLAPLAPVSVTIGGQPARVVAATAQRMRVSGMLEVTAEIPQGIGPGAQRLVLKTGQHDNADQNVSVWVR